MKPGNSRPAWYAVVLLCADALSGTMARAGEKPADAALLEFLGSVDSNMPGWHKYLADVDQAAKRTATVPVKASKPADPPSPATAPPQEQQQ